MKRITLLFMSIMMATFVAQAQSADEILSKYFENTGGLENWNKIEGVKISAKINQMGMEIPVTLIQYRDGRQANIISFQGKDIKQGVYDGQNFWSHNFMTMKAEKSDAESTENFKTTLGDFPDPFLNYQSRGYKVELMGKETVEGSECYKIKLTRKPIKVDGKPQESISYYFFDANDYVPILTESEMTSGEARGMISQVKYSDYQEVNGVLFPFSIVQGVKGGQSQPLTVAAIEVNPKADPTWFAFPSDK